MVLVASLLTVGCGPSVSQQRALMMMAQVPAEQSSPATLLPEQVDPLSYRLAPGDLIDVKFTHHPEENERVPLRPDGLISLQIAGDINAAGLTVSELERLIVEKSSRTLRDPGEVGGPHQDQLYLLPRPGEVSGAGRGRQAAGR